MPDFSLRETYTNACTRTRFPRWLPLILDRALRRGAAGRAEERIRGEKVRDGGNGERGGGRGSFENSHRSLELRAPAFPTPLPVRLFHFLSCTLPSPFFFPPARPPVPRLRHRTLSPRPLLPDSFARLHSAGSHPVLPGRAQIYSVDSATGGIAVLYTRRESIDSRARIWKHYIFPLRTFVSLSRKPCVVNIESTFLWHGLLLFLCLPAVVDHPGMVGCLPICDFRQAAHFELQWKYLIVVCFSITMDQNCC